MTIKDRMKQLNILLPPPGKPLGSYSIAVRTGNLIYLSGTGPAPLPGVKLTGRLGVDLNIEDGYLAARASAISALANLENVLGSLDGNLRFVKMTGYIQCNMDFTSQVQVLNGATDLLVELFGEKGKPARVAVGMASLPFNIPVELDLMVEVDG